MLILVDSGILLRLMERADPLNGMARQAIRTLVGRGDEIVTSFQNLAEFWNVCTRPASARGGFGLDTAETFRRMRIVERLCRLLPDHADGFRQWRQLIVAYSVKGKQVHDCRLAANMQAHGITHILTLNGADFSRYPNITIIDPTSIAAQPAPPSAAPSAKS